MPLYTRVIARITALDRELDLAPDMGASQREIHRLERHLDRLHALQARIWRREGRSWFGRAR